MSERNYAEIIDRKPPEGAVEEMRARGAFKQNYIVYRAARYTDPLTGKAIKGVECRCAECGTKWYEEYKSGTDCGRYAPAPFGFIDHATKESKISGRDMLCPWCGKESTALHIGSMPKGKEDDEWCMSIGRAGENLVLYEWLIRRFVDKNAEVTYETMLHAAYVFEKKKTIRLMGYMKCLSGVRLFGCWEQRQTYLDVIGPVDKTHILPYDPEILQGSTCENSKLDIYIGETEDCCPVSYLRVWQKHPQIENLVVQGCSGLVNKLIKDETTRYYMERPKGTPRMDGINWKEKKPFAMLGLTKEEFRVCAGQKWDMAALNLFKELKSQESIRAQEDMALVLKYGVKDTMEILRSRHRGKLTVMRCLRYLENQKRRKNIRGSEGARILTDYWRLAGELGRDLTDTGVQLPKNVKFSHDRMNEELERASMEKKLKDRKERIAARAEKFAARAAYLQQFAWELDGMQIFPAPDEKELIREGALLHHCVSTYAAQICAGTSAIFFIRRAEAPEDPWYTLELDEETLTVRQNRGSHNCDKTKEVQAFEDAWIEHIKTLKIRKESAA